MGVVSGIKKNPIGSAKKAKDIKDVAGDVADTVINDANNNRVETAKSLSSLLLNILGIMTPMAGGSIVTDITDAGVNGAIDDIAGREKQIDDAINNAINGNVNGTSGGLGGDAGDTAGKGDGGSSSSIPHDPLVFDLDGDGVELTNLEGSTAYFDLNGDGFATRTSWLSGDDGFLALDRNEDGKINDISELFGSPERTGYDELSELDSNGDGVIDADDTRFAELKLWQDEKGDTTLKGGIDNNSLNRHFNNNCL